MQRSKKTFINDRSLFSWSQHKRLSYMWHLQSEILPTFNFSCIPVVCQVFLQNPISFSQCSRHAVFVLVSYSKFHFFTSALQESETTGWIKNRVNFSNFCLVLVDFFSPTHIISRDLTSSFAKILYDKVENSGVSTQKIKIYNKFWLVNYDAMFSE